MPTTLERAWPVAAVGRMAASVSMMADTRRRLQAELTSHGMPANLRNADDQSVVSLVAVRQAIESCGSDFSHYRDWGVIAAPRSLGRVTLTNAIPRFAKDGAWGVSPHIIPNCSLHSPSGMVSVTYGFRGPNFGVGGVKGRESDVWTALLAFDATATVPGTWLILSGVGNDDICRAIALAIRFQQVARDSEITLRFGTTTGESLTPQFTLESFDRVLSLPVSPRSYCRWSLNGGGSIEWRSRAAEVRKAA